MTIDILFQLVKNELNEAQTMFPRMTTPHDALDIILEEAEELREAVRHGLPAEVRKEAVQLMAMIARFGNDLDFAAAVQKRGWNGDRT